MAHAQSFLAEAVPAAPVSSEHPRHWKIFAAIIDALHHSRRQQARRILHQYRHLIDQTQGHVIPGPNTHAGEQ